MSEKEMTNDELNRWYHEHLGKCVHDIKKVQFYDPPLESDDIKYICQKCEVSFNTKDEAETPYYLSDSGVILGIIKEYKMCIDSPNEDDENGEWLAQIFIPNPDGATWKCIEMRNESLERAVMLALKAKVENENSN